MSVKSEESLGGSAAQEAQATIAFVEKAVVRVVVAILIIAVVAGVLYASSKARDLVPWVVALATGLAAMLAGGIIGLLFGVPRRDANAAASGGGYSGNDNLVKVSDWLTGALTGIALATARDMSDALWRVCQSVLPGYPGFALACIVGGFCAGFLMAYLRLRASLPFIFAHYDRRADDAALQRDLAREKEARNYEDARAKSAEAGTRNPERAASAKSISDRVKVVREAMAAEYQGDPNKGQYGGSPRANGYVLRMKGHRIGEDGMLNVDLEVSGTQPGQLPSHADFYLHPSFPAPVIRKPADSDGIVRMSVWLFEAFTVGVVVEPGQVALELDLAQLPDIPQEYR